MKIVSLIAATAALIVSAWAVTVPPAHNFDSESLQDAKPFVQTFLQRPAVVVIAGDTNRARIAGSDASHNTLQGNSFAIYWQCRKYIEQNFQRLRSVQQIARECHLDAARLRSAFQHYGHQTPEQFLLHAKLKHTAEYAIR
jgi:hypothetical protein